MDAKYATTYTTRDQAIQAEIIDAIEAGGIVKDARAEYDIQALADKVLSTIDRDGHDSLYYCCVELDEFWQIVPRYATTSDGHTVIAATDPWADLHSQVDDLMPPMSAEGLDMSVDGVFDHQGLVREVHHLCADLYNLRTKGENYFDHDGGRLDDAYATALGLVGDMFIVLDRLAERRNQPKRVDHEPVSNASGSTPSPTTSGTLRATMAQPTGGTTMSRPASTFPASTFPASTYPARFPAVMKIIKVSDHEVYSATLGIMTPRTLETNWTVYGDPCGHYTWHEDDAMYQNDEDEEAPWITADDVQAWIAKQKEGHDGHSI